MSRALAWKLLALGGVVGLLLVQWLDPQHRPDFSDFKVYWLAGEKAAAHRTVYDVAGHYQYKYSPFVALLWALPHALPGARYHWAYLHYAACGVGFVALWFWLARAVDRSRAFWLWLAVLVVFSIGLRDELKLGQANLWPFLLVLPAWFVGRRGRHQTGFDWRGFAVGALWACAIQWKLYALILGPIWLLRRRSAVWLGAVAFTLLSFGLLAAAHGGSFASSETVRWAQSLTTSSEELLVSEYNVSALGILGKWSRYVGLSLGPWALLAWAGLAAAWGVTLLWAERAADSGDAAYRRFWSTSFAWTGIVILNPLVWPYWLMFCVPLFVAYIADVTRTRADLGFAAVCGLFALANWTQNTSVAHYGVSFLAVLVLLFDAQRRARRRDPPARAPVSDLSLTLEPSR